MLRLDQATDRLRLLGDPSRVRLLALLARQELSVAELTEATRLAQSRVSAHLARLREAGFLRVRQAGTAAYYAFDESAPDGPGRALWELLAGSLDDSVLADDTRRLAELQSRRQGSWADSVAGRMERHYSPGRTWESAARALVGLCRYGRVLDVASGDGALAELLAGRAQSVTCLDRSAAVMTAAARRRRPGGPRFVRADMHHLPWPDGSFDQVLLLNALSHAQEPARVVAEALRVLVPGGALVATTLRRHEYRAEAARFDHVQPGFLPARLSALVERAGGEVESCEVTSRERRPPHFEVLTLFARRHAAPAPTIGAARTRRRGASR